MPDRTHDMNERQSVHGQPLKRYVPPRLVDYGSVSRLTESGGATTKDFGNMLGVKL
ncbi:MAG TPA: lasso RiPP family leader peptide-containing protein [Vicinamibacterales bacterium]|nr:lasso RiPP family leader peptide-containing protein [Vicinamibacterales bacterium]